MDEHAVEARLNRADVITGIIFVALGLAVAYLSWTMPRLEARGIHPATVPGLVPGLLGLGLALCGVILAARAHRDGRDLGWGVLLSGLATREFVRFVVMAGMALAYSLALVGLVPFWLASALFVFAFIFVFETWLSPEPGPYLRVGVLALVQALVVGFVVTLVFQYGFLVRLP